MSDAASGQVQERFEQSVERKLEALLTKMGNPYKSRRQVKVSVLHWPDVFWFDNRVPRELFRSAGLRWGIPVVGFEIESSSSMQSIKAAINNLEALHPALGCIVIPETVARQKRSQSLGNRYTGPTAKSAIQYLADRSALPIVVITDQEIDDFVSGPDLGRDLRRIATVLADYGQEGRTQ